MVPGDLVFVYGSLKRRQGNHYRLGKAEYVTDAVLPFAQLYDLGAFPGLRLSERQEDTVSGEIFRIDSEDTAWSVDALEGHPDFYRREVREASVTQGDNIRFYNVWVYVFQTDMSNYPERVVRDGCWR